VWYYESVAITSSSVKFRLEKFDGSINFGLWNFEVMDMLVQAGLQKVLIGTCTLINTDVRCSDIMSLVKELSANMEVAPNVFNLIFDT
jgi:hypothetical protein